MNDRQFAILKTVLIIIPILFILNFYDNHNHPHPTIGLVTPCYMPWEKGVLRNVGDTVTVVYGFYGGIMLDDCEYEPTPYLQLKASDPSVIKLLPKPTYNRDRRGKWDSYQKFVVIRPGKTDIYLHYTKLYPRKYKIGSLRVVEKEKNEP